MESQSQESQDQIANSASAETGPVAEPSTAQPSAETPASIPPAAATDNKEERVAAKRKREDSDRKGGADDSSSKRLRLRSSSKESSIEIEPQPTTTGAVSEEGDNPGEVSTGGAGEVQFKEELKETADSKESKKETADSKESKKNPKDKKRLRGHQMAEEYVELSAKMMLMPTKHLGPYGYAEGEYKHQDTGECAQRNYPLELISSLGYLKSPLRRPTVIEKWSPYEISLFEAGMGHYGKDFYQIHKLIQSKSTKEVIDFYYIWKKTSHYKVWKKQHVAPGEIISDEEYGSTPVKKPVR